MAAGESLRFAWSASGKSAISDPKVLKLIASGWIAHAKEEGLTVDDTDTEVFAAWLFDGWSDALVERAAPWESPVELDNVTVVGSIIWNEIRKARGDVLPIPGDVDLFTGEVFGG